jgi:CheY-like chemotaxis protein
MAVRGEERIAGPTVGTDEATAPTVLVVDDDASVLRIMRMLFEETGHRVIEAATGTEALDKLATTGDVDLVVSDINMPEMDGLELCWRLEQKGCDARVLLVSAMEIDPEEVRASVPLVAGVFRKPFSIAALMRTAETVIG